MAALITGHVIDRRTDRPAADLRVELRDREALAGGPPATSLERTNVDGFFQLEATEDLLTRLREGRLAALFFRLIKEGRDTPVEVDAREARWHMDGERPLVEIWTNLLPAEDPARRVAGQVSRQDGSPILGLIVRAFDQDLGDAEPLGDAVTDAYGIYAIVYSADQLHRVEKHNADLIVRVFSIDANPQVLAASATFFNAPVDARVDITVELSAASDLSEYEQLVTKLAPFLGDRQPQDLTDQDILGLAENTSLARSWIVALVQSARLAQETDLSTEIFYGLIRRDLPPNLEGLLARTPDALRAALESAFELKLIPATVREAIAAIMQLFERLRAARTPLNQLAPALELDRDSPLLAHLAGRDIHTLADIRSSGGVSNLSDLPVPIDDPAVHVLDAHARLSLLPTDLSINARLVKAGYVGLDDIAATPHESFLASLGDQLDADTATLVHATANAQSRFLGNVLSDMRVNAVDGALRDMAAPLARAIPQVCGCGACQHADSPLAYLADLLNYAVRHLKHAGQAIDLAYLEGRFHQPLRDLPAACELLEQRVRQVRICIEVLRKELPAVTAQYTPQTVLHIAYLMLLERIGTSFEEIRQARAWPEDRQRVLVKRLGLFLEPTQRASQVLNELFRDPDDPTQLTEDYLELLFGLRDTRRDPLALDGESRLLALRLNYLRYIRWWQEDWPAQPPTDTWPLIDPDIIGPEDMVYAVLTLPERRPRTPNMPIHFWEDRRDLVDSWLGQIRQAHQDLQDPQKVFEAFITDRAFSVINNRWVQLNLGIGLSMADFQTYRDRRLQGTDLSADLGSLKLSVVAFDYLVAIWDVLQQQPPGMVLVSEWEAIYAILVQRLKQDKFADWRAEEKAMGFTLSPQYFRLRTSPLAASPEWHAIPEMRQQWVDTLRARVEQEQAIREALQAAISVTEEATLHHIRDALIIEMRVPPGISDKAGWLTERLQIDCKAGVCEVTTRVAQAIETIQGVLFGARNGLLEDTTITLDAPGFDLEWSWIGSYASWRSAMQVFLYPENALLPTLRREKSKAFEDLITTFRQARLAKPTEIQKAVDAYTSYFDDVCSLVPIAIYETGNWVSDSTTTDLVVRPFVIVARARSGKLYFAAFDALPDWWRSSVPGHTLWQEIEGLQPNSDVLGFLPYQSVPGQVRVGLYARYRPSSSSSSESLYFTSYDGTGWTAPQPITELPALVNTIDYRDGIIPADAELMTVGINGWRINGADRLVPLYVEGFGSSNRTAILIVAAERETDGKRRIGLLRGQGGGLILTAFNTIDGGWNLPPGEPRVLWAGGVQRVLLMKEEGPLTQLGLLGTRWPTGTALEVLWQTNDGFVYAPGGAPRWQVKPVVRLVGLVTADIDSDSFTELIAVEYETTTDRFGVSLPSTRMAILHASGTGLELRVQQYLNHPYIVSQTSCRSPIHVKATRFVPVRFNSQDFLLHLALDDKRTWNRSDCEETDRVNVFAWESVWDWTAQRLKTHFTVQGIDKIYQQPPPALTLTENDDFVAVDLPNSNQGALWLSPTRSDILVLTHQPTQRLAVTWQTTGGSIDPAIPGVMGPWSYRLDDRFMLLGLGSRRDLIVTNAGGSELAALNIGNGGSLSVRWRMSNRVRLPGDSTGPGWQLTRDARYIAIDLDNDGTQEFVTLTIDGRLGVLRSVALVSGVPGASLGLRNIGPINVNVREIVSQNSSHWLLDRQAQIANAYALNQSPSLARYLNEAYYYVPVEIALRLRESGYYTEALDWLRSVYDYARPIPQRKIAYKLVLDEQVAASFERYPSWLRDPLNPHTIAETRPYSYTRFTIIAIVRCLLDFADAEFTRATAESVPRARELYLEALELLVLPELNQRQEGCKDQIGTLSLQIGEDEYIWVWDQVRRGLKAIRDGALLTSTVQQISAILTTDSPIPVRLAQAQQALAEAQQQDASTPVYDALLTQNAVIQHRAQSALLADRATERTAVRLGNAVERMHQANGYHFLNGHDGNTIELQLKVLGHWEYVPAPLIPFCIPPNRVIQALRSRLESSLYKIRTCRNIAGMEMQLDPYVLPTAADAGLQNLGSADQLAAFQQPVLQPLPYRYATLIERTKQLVQLAQQIESSLLESLRSKDQAEYDLLKARQDLSLVQAGVRLKDLQLVEATDGVTLAELQRDRAQMQTNHYKGLINQGLSVLEKAGLTALGTSIALEFAGIYSPKAFWEWAGKAAPAFAKLAEVANLSANYERRAEEWRYQQQLGEQEVRLNQQQIRLAQDRLRISDQDRAIAALQVTHAEAMLEFIDTKKFGGAALYEWMSGVLEQVYRFFLQEATAMAQLAQAQLAFERQEISGAFIQADYWEPPSIVPLPASSQPGPDGQTVNVHGMTGSARLLRDVYELDQYAFQANQRKLQLTETISLAQLDPFAFQRFRESGVLHFATPMSLFDRKFPGHYLRLIRRVRTSVIALIPPTHGIRATLATTGSSRVVIGGDTFQIVRVQRGPESVALSAALNATGLFELDTQPEMLVPFEGIGVDTTWEFSMPRAANPFNYDTIADVLITIEHTALNSFDYRQQVIRSLDRTFSADRAFSFGTEFADAWYDLHNPELVEDAQKQMVVTFKTERADFPPNLDDDSISIKQIVLYFAHAPGKTFEEIQIAHLQFNRDGNTDSVETVAEGVVSTRTTAFPESWRTAILGQKPFGEWELSFNYGNQADDNKKIRDRFKNEKDGKIEDILFVITYSGNTPEWPA